MHVAISGNVNWGVGGVCFGAVNMYLFTSAPKTLDYGTSELERKRWLRCVGTGDRVARTIWTSHCVLLRIVYLRKRCGE